MIRGLPVVEVAAMYEHLAHAESQRDKEDQQ